METGNINDDMSTLPPEAQRQVVDFIAFLKLRYKQPQTDKAVKPKNIANEGFIGIWKNRKDIQDSSKWVRDTRKSEWASR